MYKNHEGYADPTVGEALSRLMREYKSEMKVKWHRQYEIKNRPKVYVISKYAGDVERNVQNAIGYCKYVIARYMIPVASHLLYPAMLDDRDPEARELGTLFGLSLLAVCDEVWCFGKDVSTGMRAELQEARKLDKPIRYFEEVPHE